MLNADENVIDELKSMSFSKQPKLQWGGGRGSSTMEGSSLHRGKASFDAKSICPNEFCSRL